MEAIAYLTLIDKYMLTYVNKELYFFIHSNKKFKRELNFVKCIAKINNWHNFLNLKFDETLNKFKEKVYCDENMYSYITYVFFLFQWKEIFLCLVFTLTCFTVCTLMIIPSDFFSHCRFTKPEEQYRYIISKSY